MPGGNAPRDRAQAFGSPRRLKGSRSRGVTSSGSELERSCGFNESRHSVAVAFHEAGHAVMAWHLGKRFRAVSIVGTAWSSGRVCFCEPFELLPAGAKSKVVGEEILMLLAGPMAAWPFEGRFRSARGVVDIALAERLARRYARTADPSDWLTQLKEEAWNRLARTEMWCRVMALADALLERGKLPGRAARMFIEGSVSAGDTLPVFSRRQIIYR